MPKIAIAAVVLGLLLASGVDVASAKTYRFKPVAQSAGTVTFDVKRIARTSRIRSARFTDGRRGRAISVRRVRDAIRGSGRVRVSRSARAGRPRQRLVVIAALNPASGSTSAVAPQPAGAGDATGAADLGTAAQPAAAGDALLSDDFSSANGANGLITNEYAFWNPDPQAVRSPAWQVTSGSLFSKNAVGWSGYPDAITPVGLSLNGSGSSVFRMRTKATYSGSTRQQVSARINAFGPGTSTRPATAWDGVVLWPRYISDTHLYFAYILRRDGRVAITKKCAGNVPGGEIYNNGSYFNLTTERYFADTTPGTWYRLATEAIDNPDGSVTIRLYRNDQLAAQATDTGTGCPPIHGPARLGIRGDNTDFNITDYKATNTP